MSKVKQSILLLNAFSTGILFPVLSLILLERGADLKTLPLLIALYAVSALCFEIPSGICADLCGRKTAFLLSGITKLFSLTFLLMADNMGWLVICVIFNGISRSFSSGSLDALIIEQAVDLEGEDCLPRISARLSILEAAGFAAGSILGGVISYAAGTQGVIMIQAGFTIVVFLLCVIWIKEARRREDQSERIPLSVHLKRGKDVVLAATDLKYILAGMFFTGFLLISIETYWQPVYLEVSSLKNSTWALGFISFLGFLMAASGNAVSERLLLKFPLGQWKVYVICRLVLGLFLILLSLLNTGFFFVLGYAGIYLFSGSGNVAENTLINRYTPNHVRASILSLSSFVFQAGSLSASLISSLMVERMNVKGIWILSGILLSTYIVVILLRKIYRRTKKVKVETTECC
jgi:MFS family permease